MGDRIGAYLILGSWGLALGGAIRSAGIRRVLWSVAVIVLLAFTVAFKVLGAIVGGGRRY